MKIPTVTDITERGERSYDIFSRLLKDRIILLFETIDEMVAEEICAQLLFLEFQDKEKDIHLYINSPGGVVTDTFAIMDTMNLIKPDVSTVCIGQACSGGSLLLTAGANGKRFITPNGRVMIHQPLGGTRGQATDIEIQAKEILKLKEIIAGIYADTTNKSLPEVKMDLERDKWLDAKEAVEYGLVDKIL